MINRNGKPISFWVKVSLIFFVILAGFISWSIFKQTLKKREIQKEISKLQKEANKISQENELIKEKITYFKSQEYQEKEAKEKLNLKKPDENVVIVKPNIIKKELEEESEEMENVISEKIVSENNFKKWLNYFFHK